MDSAGTAYAQAAPAEPNIIGANASRASVTDDAHSFCLSQLMSTPDECQPWLVNCGGSPSSNSTKG